MVLFLTTIEVDCVMSQYIVHLSQNVNCLFFEHHYFILHSRQIRSHPCSLVGLSHTLAGIKPSGEATTLWPFNLHPCITSNTANLPCQPPPVRFEGCA